MGRGTICPSCTVGRTTTLPTVTTRVSGATGIAHPDTWVNIPIDVTPTAGPNVAEMLGLVAAIPESRAAQRSGQPHEGRGQPAPHGASARGRASSAEASPCLGARRRVDCPDHRDVEDGVSVDRPLHRGTDVDAVEEQQSVARLPRVHLRVLRDRPGHGGDHEAGPRHRRLRRARHLLGRPRHVADSTESVHGESSAGPAPDGGAIFRPWLQYFDDFLADRARYRPPRSTPSGTVRTLGSGWMMWDPSDKYARGGLGSRS